MSAPYHSAQEAPKSNALKQEMYDWLQDNLEGPAKDALLPFKDMRRPVLWNMIKEMKSGNEYYVVDNEAKKYGNTVLRLPPYNWYVSESLLFQ